MRGNHLELDKKKKKEKGKKKKEREEPVLDFTIQLSDQNKQTTSVEISEIKRIAPMLKTRFTKLKSLDEDMIGRNWEIQPETFLIGVVA